jgi:glycosyltransferase involved in cell wall biosynthesis
MIIAFDARLMDLPGIGRVVYQTAVALLGEPREDLSVVLVGNASHHRTLESIIGGGKSQSASVCTMAASPYSIAEQFEIRTLIRSRRIDVWHAPHVNLPLLSGCPVVWSVNDVIPLLYTAFNASFMATSYFRLMYLCGSRRARKILTISEATRNSFGKLFPGSIGKTETLYLGLDHSSSPGTVLRTPAFGLQLPHKYALYVGTHKPWKNLDRLFEAFALLKSEMHSAMLVLVGKQGKRKENIDGTIAMLGLADSVLQIGDVEDSTLNMIYNNASVVVCPSIEEGFGFSGLEAMRRSVPVAASDIPVFREVYQDGCVYFDPLNARSIADVLRDVFQGTVPSRDLVEKGRRVAAGYSWSDYANKLVAVYRIVGGRGESGPQVDRL